MRYQEEEKEKIKLLKIKEKDTNSNIEKSLESIAESLIIIAHKIGRKFL